MMIAEVAKWLSIVGYILVARKNINGLYLWLVANFLWVLHFYEIDEMDAFQLFAFYFFTTLYAIHRWRRNGAV